MSQLTTLSILENELGEVLESGATGESLYYSVRWEELRGKANRKLRADHWPTVQDIRAAGFALDILGIPNEHSEVGQDDRGNWIVYWR